MLVPEISAKFWPERMGLSKLTGLHAPHIWSPGARMSGFSTSAGFSWLLVMSGPLDEVRATAGAVFANVAILPSLIAALAP